ncbi:hypothetical protein INT47_008592 [Mucor saturninus]|uniref:Uncharacterized protein n=1 Tax=Mucor saturninus TaxID=64648 RepID=A0A8H7R9W5_9FUNG|nr:hypothetical protein INT47_008592 [Mucor saturninus]
MASEIKKLLRNLEEKITQIKQEHDEFELAKLLCLGHQQKSEDLLCYINTPVRESNYGVLLTVVSEDCGVQYRPASLI